MEDSVFYIDLSDEAYRERFTLASERVFDFPGDLDGAEGEYFAVLRDLAVLCLQRPAEKKSKKSLNEALFRELTEDGYRDSFLNPDTAVRRLGSCGQLLSAWYSEFRGIIPFSFEGRIRSITVLLETSIQIFNLFEEKQSGSLEEAAVRTELAEIIYSYLYDYAGEFVEEQISEETDPGSSFALDLVMHADLNDTGEDSYLYSFGEWITEEELMTARLLSELSEEEIRRMASAFTEGYIRGFAATGKDIKKKSIVSCCLPLGFERFMREAVRQFAAAGLRTVIPRYPVRLLGRKLHANIRPGFYGAFSMQYEYDHREDLALFWGDKLKARKLQALKEAYENKRELLAAYSGRACVEIFGIGGGAPVNSPARTAFSEHQLEVERSYAFAAHELARKYMPDEETSYTIIAWPTPSIAGSPADYTDLAAFTERYREIFRCFIDINTLPADRWQQIQQRIIDVLDRADCVEIRGTKDSRTDMRVMLHRLNDPAHETNFENCLADVNIPAGEVFTSPLLKGTEGTINPDTVYIGGYLFKDLCITFRDGRVCDYSCSNYEDPEQGRALIRKIIFRDREELPLGEFAIGTNTAACAAAARYGIGAKMPVLIAEKTGPHFAVGDTCYSYEEDMVTYNPDGKRITARENECSALRRTDPEKAFFNVHTDITLPYGGIAYVAAVGRDGRTLIIENGRYVLPGTEELNDALD